MRSTDGSADQAARRTFLSRLVIVIQGVMGATIAVVVGGASLAPGFAAPRRSWQRAAALGDIDADVPTPLTLRLIRQDGYRQVVDRRVVYVQRDGAAGVRVLDSTCTHLGCRTRYDDAQRRFVCPCHGGVYALDGTVLAGPPPAPLRRLDARVDGADVVVRV
jgi:Rieske Fe-S protein